MIEHLAMAVVVATAFYFLVLGTTALVRPGRASGFLLGFADSAVKHYGELSIRLAVGFSLLIVAQRTPFPIAFTTFGWVLVGTTAMLALVPWRWHHRFASRAVPQAIRYIKAIGIGSIAIGAALLAAILIG